MPRDGSGVYSKPAGTTASPNVVIESAKYNAFCDDLVTDANAARPITAGGTGETSARLKDGTWRFQNTADTTKLVAVDLSGLTTGTTRTLTVPDESGTIITTTAAAGQAAMETESASGYVRPSHVKYSPGVAKCWVHCGVTGNIFASYGVSSVTDNGVGDVTVNQSVTFSSNNAPVVGMPYNTTSFAVLTVNSYNTTSFRIYAWDSVFAKADPAEYFLARFGDI